MKNKKMVRALSITLAAVLTAGTVGVMAYAAGTSKAAENMEAAESSTAKIREAKAVEVSDLKEMLEVNRKVGKEETVYVLAAADGSVNKVIVSDWLKNPEKEQSLADLTELADTVNVKGDEDYSVLSGNARVWNADGNDIYYQGTTEKALPVEVKISYWLDGKEVTAEELAGKSGHVTMRFDYQNNQKQGSVYVPFVMVTGMVLDNEIFSNVQVSNGKLLNDGDRSVVMGFALPGLQENLKIDKKDLEIPSFVEVTADVKNFALTTSLTIATNDVFNGLKVDDADSLSGLSDSLAELQDASLQLMDGSSELYDGLSTLLEKSGELIAGIDQLYTGAGQLKDGTEALCSGSAALDGGLTQLNTGLAALAENNAALQGGATQVFQSLLAMADGQLAAAGVEVPKLTVENYEIVLNGVLDNIKAGKAQGEAAMKQAQEKAQAAAQAGIQMTAEEAAQAKAMQAEVTAKLAAVDAGIQSIEGLLEQLASYNEFYQGVLSYTNGVASACEGGSALAAGSAELKLGASALAKGASDLYTGIGTLKDGSAALTDGVTKLTDGAMQLSDGMKEFNEKGIEKLVEALDGDLDGLVSRLKATVEASEEYQSFAGIADGMEGSVKFIYRTEAIGE